MTSLKNFIKPTITTVNTALWRTFKCTHYTVLHCKSSTTHKSALYTVNNTNEIRNGFLRAAGWVRCWGWRRHKRLLINSGWWTPPPWSSARCYSDSARRRRRSLNSLEHPLSPYRLTGGVRSTALRRNAAPFIREGGGGRRPKPRKKHPLPTHRIEPEAVCGGCSSLTVFGLFRPIASIFYMLTSSMQSEKPAKSSFLDCNNNFLFPHEINFWL